MYDVPATFTDGRSQYVDVKFDESLGWKKSIDN
jgi:hypothetical protein